MYARAVEIKQRQARQKIKNNPDWRIKHPGEARDANDNKFTMINARIKKDVETAQILAITRRLKNANKNW